MDLGGLGSSSSSMQVSVDEYRSITYIPKNNSFKFYFRFSSHDDLKSDITLTFPMNSTAASLNFYFYMSILPDDESGTLIATMSSSAPLSAIRNESSNLSFHFQKLTDPYEVLTQKDASELANDTLDMAVPYWADLLKGSGITLRSLGFSTTNRSSIPGNTPGYYSQGCCTVSCFAAYSVNSSRFFFNSSILSLNSAACSKFRSAAAARICFST